MSTGEQLPATTAAAAIDDALAQRREMYALVCELVDRSCEGAVASRGEELQRSVEDTAAGFLQRIARGARSRRDVRNLRVSMQMRQKRKRACLSFASSFERTCSIVARRTLAVTAAGVKLPRLAALEKNTANNRPPLTFIAGTESYWIDRSLALKRATTRLPPIVTPTKQTAPAS